MMGVFTNSLIICYHNLGLCCENDFFFRISIDGENRDCSWISKSSTKKSEYCGREDVKNACPQVCDGCLSKVTMAMLQSDKDTEKEHEVVNLAPISIFSSTPSKESPMPTKFKDEISSLPTNNAPIEIDMTETKKGVTTSPVLAPSPIAVPSMPTNEVKLLLPTNAPIEIKNEENDTNSIIQESDKSAHIHDADDSIIGDNKQTTQIEETHEKITDGTKSGASLAVMPVVVGVAIAAVGVGTGIFVKRHLQRRG